MGTLGCLQPRQGSARGSIQSVLGNLQERPTPPSPWRNLNSSCLSSDPSPLPRVPPRGYGLCAGRRSQGEVGTQPGRRSPSAKELTGLSASSRPRLLHPSHYLHFITAGASGRVGWRVGGASCAARGCPRRRGRGVWRPRSALPGEGVRVERGACERLPVCLPASCPPPARVPAYLLPVCLPVGGSGAGATRGEGGRAKRAGERVCAPQPGRDAAWPWAP